MMLYVDEDFQRTLDDFNASQGGPVTIVVCWNPRKDRWTVYAVPYDYGTHPLSKTYVHPKLMSNFLDGSGRRGVLLFSWQDVDGSYLPLDDRLIRALKLADSFQSKTHFEENFITPELQRQAAQDKEVRNIAYGARSYWWNVPTVTVGSHSGGNWRRAKRSDIAPRAPTTQVKEA
jgi:hypothetical protein